MDAPNVNAAPPNQPGVPSVEGAPSGTYGEGAALDRLKASLPDVKPPLGKAGPAGPGIKPFAPKTQAPSLTTGRPPVAQTPPNFPSVLALPTQRPDVPVATPLAAPPGPPLGGAATRAQATLGILFQLAQSPDVSATTQAWATHVIGALLSGRH